MKEGEVFASVILRITHPAANLLFEIVLAAKLARIRARIEKIFGTWKRSYHFRAMRWVGLAKARCQVHLAAIAYNFKRYWRLQAA